MPKPASNIVSFAAFKATSEIPPSTAATENGGKISTQDDKGGNAGKPENTGLSAVGATPPQQTTWGKKKEAGEDAEPATPAKPKASPTPSKAATKVKSKASPTPAKPSTSPKKGVGRTPGPNGYIIDCKRVLEGEWTLGQLVAAYPGEAMSYKKRREYALTHDEWSWNLEEWPNFCPFLLDMKPWPDDGQKYELDRIDPAIKAYGPGLCQWLLKPENAGKKSTNKKIVIPFTGEVFTPNEIAVLTGVSVKTVYDRMAHDWSPLELREGRPSDFLCDLSAKLAEVHPAPLTPTKGMKPPETKIDIAAIPTPDDWKFWQDSDEGFEYEHQYEDPETFNQLRAERDQRRKAEYEALVSRCKAYNAGLPLPPKPEREFYTFGQRRVKPPTPPPQPASGPSEDADDDDYIDESSDDPGDVYNDDY